jgi:phage terminase large subunit
MRDFTLIMKAQQYWSTDAWNATYSTYTFPSGSIIEFFSSDSDKAHGPRRDILFLNECNNVSYDIYTQLETRTRRVVILDYNPVSTFWVHEEVMPHNPHDYLQLTYRDNRPWSQPSSGPSRAAGTTPTTGGSTAWAKSASSRA